MFLQSFNPNPVLLHLGPVTLYWYGLLMMLAIVAGLLVVRRLAVRSGLAQPPAIYDLAFVVILSALVGARVYAVLLFLPDYLAGPWEVFKVWHGGLAIHGALLGGGLALWWYCRRKRQSSWAWADILAVALPLGQAIGRWGNYFNQELFGRPTSLPWGILIDPTHRPAGYELVRYYHPTFLYESLLNAALGLVLWWLYRRRKQTGVVLSAYLAGYGVIRLLMEQLRLDETPVIFGLRWPVLVSVLLVMIGVSGLMARQRRPITDRS